MRDKLNDPARLELILESISNIEGFLVGTTTCEEFIANKILCHAVVYNLQCIGERFTGSLQSLSHRILKWIGRR